MLLIVCSRPLGPYGCRCAAFSDSACSMTAVRLEGGGCCAPLSCAAAARVPSVAAAHTSTRTTRGLTLDIHDQCATARDCLRPNVETLAPDVQCHRPAAHGAE